MENFADNGIGLGDKVPVRTGVCGALPCFCRDDWVVRTRKRDVSKVWLFGFGLRGDPLCCLTSNIRKDALKVPVFQAWAGAIELEGFLDMCVGDADGLVIFDIDVRREVRCIHAKPSVKSTIDGSILDRLGEVNIGCAFANRGWKFAIRCLPSQAEVPFTEASRGVAITAEQEWDIETVAFENGCSPRGDDALFEDAAPRIASGEEAIACWGANGGW